MRWDWDAGKSEANRRKHKVGFEAAALVFGDPLAATIEDPHQHETRWRTIGTVGPAVLLVIHTFPEADPAGGEEVGRIISARKATSAERRAYEEGDC